MSFEVFVHCFEKGESASLPCTLIRRAFGPQLIELEPTFWQLRFDEANWCDLYLTVDEDDSSRIFGFMVSRPCSDERLWDALASILAVENAVLFFPGSRAPIVGRSDIAQHLPPGMVESLGVPVVVTSGAEILNEIHAA
jgi:hypothetical protein